jgi:pimeloyl-ACP methyl ester carboxylesterase
MPRQLPLLAIFCAALIAQSKGKFASVNGSQIYYEECGQNGINLILLHDGLVHSVTWDDVWTPLCSKFHVVRYDRRGYGHSDAARVPFAPEEDLASLMRVVKMERAILVGNSSGAGLALDFALAHPAMTEGLVLIGPVVHGMPRFDVFPGARESQRRFRRKLVTGQISDFRREPGGEEETSRSARSESAEFQDGRAVRDAAVSTGGPPAESDRGTRAGARR